MPFFSVTEAVRRLIVGGAFDEAERLVGRGWTFDRIVDAIRRRYTPTGGLPYAYQVYQAVVNRAAAALVAGRQLSTWPAERDFPYEMHVGTPGLSTQYRYAVIGTFVDPDTGRQFTRPFFVGSDTAMNRVDVLREGEILAIDWGSGGPTLPALAGHEPPQLIGVEISDALVRI